MGIVLRTTVSVMLFVALLLCLASSAFAGRLPYIVNGKDAAPGEFPWQASLQVFGQHTCGASLVSDRWLVTASHCINKYPVSDNSIVLGAWDKDTRKKGTPTRYAIAKIIVHPLWDGQLHKPSDIALIQLAKKVKMTDSIKTIDLPEAKDDFGGKDCVISGWGSLYGIGTQLPNRLQKLNVRVQQKGECRAAGGARGFQICVANYGASACTGDSGGPLACKKNGRWTLVGAASYVYGNCSTRMPTVYTGVPYFRGWIKEHTGL